MAAEDAKRRLSANKAIEVVVGDLDKELGVEAGRGILNVTLSQQVSAKAAVLRVKRRPPFVRGLRCADNAHDSRPLALGPEHAHF